MDDINFLATILGLLAAIITLVSVMVKIWHDNKTLKDGIRKTYDAKELELKQREINNKALFAQQKLELDKKKHEAREKWKNAEFGLKLLDLIFSHSNEDGEEDDDEEVDE